MRTGSDSALDEGVCALELQTWVAGYLSSPYYSLPQQQLHMQLHLHKFIGVLSCLTLLCQAPLATSQALKRRPGRKPRPRSAWGRSGRPRVSGEAQANDERPRRPRWAGVSVGPAAFDTDDNRNYAASVTDRATFNYAASHTQLRGDLSVAPFFLEKDLRPGKKMTLYFPELTFAPAFLPRKEADSIPFSVEKLPEVLGRFAIQPDSIEAQWMRKTARDCEAPAMKGEKKFCATSLESMVDFSTSSLGTRDVRAVSTIVAKKGAPKQEYTIVSSGVRKLAGSDGVVCHMEAYAYAVFYCHMVGSTRAYMVKMVGKDGAAVDAVAVCHADTAAWNPKHLAFQVLKVKPGTVPICHFLLQDHVVWTRRT
uniref:BURP domain-containing protein n=1 Tax=Ananas comosus var. bracteatus TaxID=296719 RepID=A0A6V7NZV1_ANACO|nr:unnamed protein product [Ananas comosus var. bracteatus]